MNNFSTTLTYREIEHMKQVKELNRLLTIARQDSHIDDLLIDIFGFDEYSQHNIYPSKHKGLINKKKKNIHLNINKNKPKNEICK